MQGTMKRAPAQEKPGIEECFFYHYFDLSDGNVAGGPGAAFDLRGKFDYYIAGTDLRNKTILDFGTASGFLAFNAEKSGARTVTAFETPSLYQQKRVPFANSAYLNDKKAWAAASDAGFKAMHKSFWYMWHEYKSKVEMIYGCEDDLIQTEERFDIVIAAAVIEHLSDPVTALGLLSRITKEKLVLGFTPVFLEPGDYMKPLIPWEREDRSYVWWALSKDLYERLFENLGFDLSFHDVTADLVENGVRTTIPRQTIVATRR